MLAKSKKNMEKQLNDLTREVAMLRSVVMGTITEKDPEGEYRPEFVKKMLALVKKTKTGVAFTNSKDFLKKIG
jgi:hypothetical protein